MHRLDHVSFLVTDDEHSRRFYKHVLGLREIPRPSNASTVGVCLTNGEHRFEVHLIGEAEQGRVTQTHTLNRRNEMSTVTGHIQL